MSGFHLNLSLMTPGHYRHAWRLPHSDPTAYLDVDYFVRLAKICRIAIGNGAFLPHPVNGGACIQAAGKCNADVLAGRK